MILHIVNKSPHAEQCLSSCLQHLQPKDRVLLIEDGVYAALRDGSMAATLTGILPDCPLYVLQEDAEARGIAERLIEGIRMVDYGGFVALTAACAKSVSWY